MHISKGNTSVSMATEINRQIIRNVDYGTSYQQHIIISFILNKGGNIALGYHPLKTNSQKSDFLVFFVAYLSKWVVMETAP